MFLFACGPRGAEEQGARRRNKEQGGRSKEEGGGRKEELSFRLTPEEPDKGGRTEEGERREEDTRPLTPSNLEGELLEGKDGGGGREEQGGTILPAYAGRT